MEKYKIALEHSANLWNSFLEINKDTFHPSDAKEFESHLHALQNIILAKASSQYLKSQGFGLNYTCTSDMMGFMEINTKEWTKVNTKDGVRS